MKIQISFHISEDGSETIIEYISALFIFYVDIFRVKFSKINVLIRSQSFQ